VWCIDVRVRSIRQLFDLRDPAPFKDRDLDPGVVEYIDEAVDDLPRDQPVAIEVFVSDEEASGVEDEAIRAAFHAYFVHALNVLSARIRAHLRQGKISLLVGLLVLAGSLLLARWIGTGPDDAPHQIVKEGVTIGGWVAIWRPVEHFLYDWWPFLAERRKLRRLVQARVKVVWGVRPSMPASSS
jgi:hypothetical protein